MQLRSLNVARPALGESNYGLALALAGNTAEAIRVLEPAARDDNADATRSPEPCAGLCLRRELGQCPRHRRAGRSRQPARHPHPSMDGASLPKTPADQVAALDRRHSGCGRCRPAGQARAQSRRHAVRGGSRLRSRCTQARLAPHSGAAPRRSSPPRRLRRRFRSLSLRAAGSAAGARHAWRRSRQRAVSPKPRRCSPRSCRTAHAPAAKPKAARHACCSARAAAIRRRSSSSALMVRPTACLPPGTAPRSKYARTQGLHADERASSPARKASSIACRCGASPAMPRHATCAWRCSARAEAASSATSRAMRRSNIASR